MNQNDRNKAMADVPATTIPTNVPTPQKKQESMQDLIVRCKPAFKMALGNSIDADRFTRIAITITKQNPLLLQCTSQSLLGALLTAAQLGFEPNVLGRCYIIPYAKWKIVNGKWEIERYDASCQLGYDGYAELFYRSPNAVSINAYVVYSNDFFEYQYGLEPKCDHIPADGDRGVPVKAYAIGRLKNGGHNFVVMSKKEIEDHRDRYSPQWKAYKKNPNKYKPDDIQWLKNPDAMWRKTVVIQCLNLLPLETSKKMDLAGSVRYFDPDKNNDIIDMTEVPDMTWENQNISADFEVIE